MNGFHGDETARPNSFDPSDKPAAQYAIRRSGPALRRVNTGQCACPRSVQGF
ncbi:Uncharacterized protein ChrSV_1132 [Chromobacterium vaccinii]|uniref:hypothetical protein n=1 Tax=Chromobacterium vaccinii TaxID=1108595 RepID=UPI000B1572A5|nr:hypothetical protein [Chromobacterium vaccinii]QND83359.1 Uncharacterized protein ChrSW_1132 [Chromobacterium vaccinii]QND88590.1 Uncharacterized protein ChrSV_1132 [Chromobacterium vaccinii]